MEAKFEIKGLDALNKELKRLPEDFRTKALNGAVGTAARLLRDEAIKNVPVDTGNLRTAIRAQKKKSYSKYIGLYQVNINPKGKITVLTRGKGRRSTSTYYARMVENGTMKMTARPFMRPAFMGRRADAIRTFQKILDKKIGFYQRKIARLAK
jgi:HK97 gp10 family phage protein